MNKIYSTGVQYLLIHNNTDIDFLFILIFFFFWRGVFDNFVFLTVFSNDFLSIILSIYHNLYSCIIIIIVEMVHDFGKNKSRKFH